MSYVETNLGRGETVRYTAHVHWIVFLPAMFFAALAVLGLLTGSGAWFWIFVVIAAIAAIPALIRHRTTELALTNKRVIARFGLLRRATIEQRLEMVDNIHVNQGIVARLVGAGSISLTGSGASKTPIGAISDPLRFRKEVNEKPRGAAPGPRWGLDPRPHLSEGF